MQITPSQTDFSGGLISGRFSGRTMTEEYRRGLKECRNFVVSNQGSIYRRPSLDYVATLPQGVDERVRLIPFPLASRPDLLLEIDSTKIRFRNDDGTIVVPPVAAEEDEVITFTLISNGDFSQGAEGLNGWGVRNKITRIRDGNVSYSTPDGHAFAEFMHKVQNDTLFMCSHTNGQINQTRQFERVHVASTIATQQLTRGVGIPSGMRNDSVDVVVDVSGFQTIDSLTRYPVGDDIPAIGALGSGGITNSPFTLTFGQFTTLGTSPSRLDIGRDLKGYVHIGTTPYGSELATFTVTSAGIKNFSFDPDGNDVIYVTLEPETVNRGSGWTRFRSNLSNDIRSIPVDSMPKPQFFFVRSVQIQNTTITPGDPGTPGGPAEIDHDFPDVDQIRWVSDTASNIVVLTHPGAPPFVIESNRFGSQFVASAPVFEGVADWGGSDGWPRYAEIYQGRLWFFASIGFPSRIWGSESGDYYKFTVGTADNSALDRKLNTRGTIFWGVGAQNVLLIGTDDGIYVSTSSGPILTPTDMGVRKVNATGSSDLAPLQVGSEILYASKNKRRIYSVRFDDNRATWRATDITLNADNLFDREILAMAYSHEPNNQLAVIFGNNRWVQCTYDSDRFNEMPMRAWHRHTTSQALLQDVISLSKAAGDEFYYVVSRVDTLHIERSLGEPHNFGLFDVRVRGLPVDNEDGSFTIPGLTQLGRIDNLQAVYRGAVIGDSASISVDEMTGDVTVFPLDEAPLDPDEPVYFGIPYRSEAELFEPETYDPMYSMLGARKRVQRVLMRILNSALPALNGQLPPDRDPDTPMDSAEPPRTEVVKYSNLGSIEFGSGIVITQNQPLYTEILGLTYAMDVERD